MIPKKKKSVIQVSLSMIITHQDRNSQCLVGFVTNASMVENIRTLGETLHRSQQHLRITHELTFNLYSCPRFLVVTIISQRAK